MAFGRRRTGLAIGRGGLLALLAGAAIIGGAFWLGPIRPLPAELELLALSPDGEFRTAVQPVVVRPDMAAAAEDAVARVPLVLAARNVGSRPARPTGLSIAVPGRYRLTGPDGDALPSRTSPGSPLIQYEIDVPFPELRPAATPTVLPAYDTLWLEAVLPQYDCAMMPDGVPEFIASPPYDAAALSTVQLYYGFEVAGEERQTGLLTVQVDPARLMRQPVSQPQRSRVSVHVESAPRPDLGPLLQIGTRRARCGDTEAPVELHTVLWQGEAGGWMYEIQIADQSRKLVYDLNRDGRVDLEIWDAEGDGGFRSMRETSYAVPSFLRPLPQRVVLAAEAQAVDTLWLSRFLSVQDGPYRFASPPRRVAAAQAAASPPAVEASPPAVLPPVAAEPVDSAWLQRFLDAEAGPFRFAAAPPPELPQRTEAPDLADAPTAPADAPAASPAEPAPRPPPRLLGEPVPWPPRGNQP